MLNFSPEKLILVGIIALVVLGPNRLPQAARTLGRVLAQVRNVSGSFQSEVRDALTEPRDALSNAVGDLGLSDLRSSVRGTMTGAVSPFTAAINPAVPAPSAATSAAPASPAVSSGPPVPDDPSLN
ncbi:MAG: twin-arginine translocase TatA/TatE family subunit [Actinomycetota bacterium]|nr:twin-arginine translocase TatA/TatE family subunit [Actinomycetota bacterium]